MSKQRWEVVLRIVEAFSIAGGIAVVVGLWIEGWLGIGPDLVIVGVAIETFISMWVFVASRKLQQIQDEELETMRRETALANERASESNRLAAEANLELERLRGRRTFAPEQREQVVRDLSAAVAALVSFGSLRAEIFTVDSDDEVTMLRDQLVDLLQQAGWDARMNLNRRVTWSPINGVTVEYQAGPVNRRISGRRGDWVTYNLGETALALVRAFQNGGLAISGPVPSSNMVTDAEIEIIVGNKL